METESKQLSCKQCLSLLRKANSDNERFAAMLFVAKALKAEDCDTQTRGELIEAIGFRFLKRLLKTDTPAEGCTKSVFPSLALSVLSAFSQDPTVVLKQEYISMIPDFCRFISSISDDDEENVTREMVDDSYECLLAITKANVDILPQTDIISTLSNCFVEKKYGSEKAFNLLVYIVEKCGPRTWGDNSETIQSLMSSLVSDFKNIQSKKKFDICSQISQIISLIPQDNDEMVKPWLSPLLQGIRGILQSKIGPDLREPTLHLVAAICCSLGIESFLPPNTADCKDFLLIIQMVTIEVRMSMEVEDFHKVSTKESLLSSCFSVIEQTIAFLTDERPMCLDSKQISMVHNALVEAANAILFFINFVSKQASDKMLELVVIGSVRVLGSWLSEETQALRKEVQDVLPFLVTISKATFPVKTSDKDTQVCTLQFLLPGLCHLTAEDEARAILLQQELHVLLAQYFSYLWMDFNTTHKHQTEMSLRTLCGVMLNLSVLETDLIKSDIVFPEVFSLITDCLTHLTPNSSHVILLANQVTLGLMIGRHAELRKGLDESKFSLFFTNVILYLREVHVVEQVNNQPTLVIKKAFQTVWEDIAELWFLAIQALGACISIHPELSETLLLSDWLPNLIMQITQTHATRDVGSDTEEVYIALLSQFARGNVKVKQLILDNNGIELARKPGNTELREALL